MKYIFFRLNLTMSPSIEKVVGDSIKVITVFDL